MDIDALSHLPILHNKIIQELNLNGLSQYHNTHQAYLFKNSKKVVNCSYIIIFLHICKNIIQYIDCSKHDNYFIDTKGILHKKVINFNSTFLAIVIPQILIKYLLHASHDSLGHVETTKLYHFLKRLYYFQGMRRKIHQYVRSCHKCQIMNLQKPHFIDLHQDTAQTPQDHITIDLLGTYKITSQGNSYTLTAVCNLTGYLMTTISRTKR